MDDSLSICSSVSPLADASEAPKRTSFLLTDIYILLAQWIGAMLLIWNRSDSSNKPEHQYILFGVWAILGWWWWLGTRRLAQARVIGLWRRVVFLWVAVPFAFGNFSLLWLAWFFDYLDYSPFFFLAYFLLILYMSFSGCRSIVSWVAKGREQPKENQDATGMV